MYFVIAGGGEVCYYLALDLVSKGHEVTVVTRDDTVVQRLEGRCTAIDGQAWDPAVLEEAGLRRADALVACEGRDEENLVICHLVELLQLPVRTIAAVHNPKNEALFYELGIDAIVGTTTTIAQVIEHELPSAELLPLMTLRRGGMKMVEGEIPYGAPCVGKALHQIAMPTGTLVITLVRGDQVILPHGGTVVEVGDVLIGLAEADSLNELRRVLFG
ncbi:MAG: TrkA family potassium uptake protein [Candidatus Eremiobacterota bacterium]